MTAYKITAKKYCEDLESLAWSDTFYKNVFPYNLLYSYGNGRFSADCNNLIKAMVNGRAEFLDVKLKKVDAKWTRSGRERGKWTRKMTHFNEF